MISKIIGPVAFITGIACVYMGNVEDSLSWALMGLVLTSFGTGFTYYHWSDS